MSIKGKAYVMGAFEHPTRKAPDKSTPQLHAECMRGALADAGLTKDDIDGYFCAGDAPGFGAMSMADYLGLRKLRHMDSTETGGSSYILHVGACGRSDCRRQVLRRAGHAGRQAADVGPGGGGGRGGRLRDGAGSCVRDALWRHDAQLSMRCARRATCTSTARPASSSPGSRSPPRITRSTTSTRSCATS